MMVESSQDLSATEESGFYRFHWRTKWLVVGFGILVTWRSLGFFEPPAVGVPAWMLVSATTLLTHATLLLFPILTREGRGSLRFPSLGRCLLEGSVAIPVVIATLSILGGFMYLMERHAPGVQTTPDAIRRMASTPDPMQTYGILVFAVAFAPFSEEVFFRGFLQNALRQRMPRTLAAIVQSLVFGFSHTFGGLHAGVAVFLGFVLTLVYEWRKTLITPICVHAGINLIWAIGMLATMAEFADRPVLGVFGSEEANGCLVKDVVPDSGAHQAGVEVGDIIRTIDDHPVANYQELAEVVRSHSIGDRVVLSVEREGGLIEVEVTLGRR